MDELLQQVRSSARGMWRWRWIGLGVTWVVAVVGAVVLWRMPDRYEATARIYVDTQTVLKPLMAGLAVQPDINQQITMLARTMITRPNIERLLRSSDLDLSIHTPQQRESMIDELSSGIRMTGGGRENIFDISYRDPDPSRARRIVQAMVSMFVETGLGGKRRDTETARRFIDDQIRSYEVKLRDSENRLKEFKLRNFGYTGEPGTDYFARVGTLNGELSRLRVELRAAEQSRDALRRELAGEEPVLLPDPIGGATGPVVPELDARIESQRRALDELMRRYTELHPDVVATQQLIKQLEAEKQQQVAARAQATGGSPARSAASNPVYQQLKLSLAEHEASIASLRAKGGELQTQLDALRASANRVPQVEAEMAQMNRDYEILQKNYEQLVARRESAVMSRRRRCDGQLGGFPRHRSAPRVAAAGVSESRDIDPAGAVGFDRGRVACVLSGCRRRFRWCMTPRHCAIQPAGRSWARSRGSRIARRWPVNVWPLPLLHSASAVWSSPMAPG
jgi:polysaccharide chain length determinant protein (PEP-CTERM system associated)